MSVITARTLAAVGVTALLAGFAAVGPPAAASTAEARGAASPATAPSIATAGTGHEKAGVARVRGAGRIDYVYSPDDTIRFGVDAEALPFTRPLPGVELPGLPTDARGTVRISHHVQATGRTGWSVADVDCLVTGGGTATLTATVRRSNALDPGTRFGVSVQQGRQGQPDRLGFSWGVVNVAADTTGGLKASPVGSCMAPAPFAPVTEGGFTVRHTELPPLPAGSARPAEPHSRHHR
ncbi:MULTISPECIES: hypothetical protein [unclassified Streptomyces]|uniref:hypothetical protein n=1 Tax=unclassified Streptomyces TaxID=2593676 RepID=UPI000823EBB9|nr:hypothetical protein [Streptomyces sp. AmelKG-E11A]SCK46952.1 hypothetical protein YW7DRAFT_04175 [Streptomyces sp. AmelKG-E11A]